MDAKKWTALLTAVRLGSFSKAAEELDYTQSGITHMMNSLEEEVGFPLLIRRWDGVRLSPEGETLLPAIQAVVDSNSELLRQLNIVGGSLQEHLCIGTYASISIHWLSSVVEQLHKEMPKVEFELRIGSRQELTDWLANGSIQLALADKLDVPGTQWTPLYEDPLLAVLPPNCAEGKTVFHPEDAGDLRLLSSSESARGGNKFTALLPTDSGVHIKTEDELVLLSMIRRGAGFSIMSELCVRDRTEGLTVLPLSEPTIRHLGVTRKNGAEKSSTAVKKLLHLLQQNLP
ncbi:MAG: LysR family transcriptional regulator [Oscillospiraceae bacterium]|nr:LysR family transcriptional regulator [Oscillospiraceae bacterium]